MKYKGIKIKKYDWEVDFFFGAYPGNLEEILGSLDWMGAAEHQYADAEKTIKENEPNYGITYSNIEEKKTVVILGNVTSKQEFNNTVVHEIQHIIQSISKVYNIDPYGEEIAYLAGDITELISPETNHFFL